MKYNGPCADTAGSVGEDRGKKEEHNEKRKQSRFFAFSRSWQSVFWPDAEAAEGHR